MNGWRRMIVWAPPVLVLIALGLALNSVRQARVAESAATAADRQRDELRRRLRHAEERLAVVKATGAKAGNKEWSKAGGEALATGAASLLPATAKPPARPPDWRIMVARDPALRALHLKAFEADLDGNWGPLFKQLNLTPDKIEQFKAILLAHERNRLDVTAVAGDQNLGLGDPAIQKQRSEDGALLAREMRALLEPEQLKVYNRYHHDFELQPIVAEMAANIYFAETPLDLPQARELLIVLSDNSEKRTYGFVRPGTLNWDAALAQIEANPVFSPALREVFRRRSAQEAAQQQLGKAMHEAVKNTGADPGSVFLPGVDFIRRGR